jgi:hypothetical protein
MLIQPRVFVFGVLRNNGPGCGANNSFFADDSENMRGHCRVDPKQKNMAISIERQTNGRDRGWSYLFSPLGGNPVPRRSGARISRSGGRRSCGPSFTIRPCFDCGLVTPSPFFGKAVAVESSRAWTAERTLRVAGKVSASANS